jgi:branched-chain amino acid transport system ATP-binding protein
MKALRVDNLCKNFDGLQALNHVRVEVEVGERQVIIGPNGAGKSTLFHIISGILSPTSGEIYLFGENITRLPIHLRANLQLAQTFQLINLFKGLTVSENIVLALQSFKRNRFTLLRRLSGFKQFIHEAEKFLKEWEFWDKRNVRVSNLSYGDQRLLDIMVALVNQPRFLLMDEPTGGLSGAEIQTITSRIKNLSKEITILFIEHNMDVAFDLADRITVLHMGEVVKGGTPEEIRGDPLVTEIYLGSGKGCEQ